MLIPIRLLINGASIVREVDCRTVSYFHIELDTHDVLLADGLPAESYLEPATAAFSWTTVHAVAAVSGCHRPGAARDGICAPFAADRCERGAGLAATGDALHDVGPPTAGRAETTEDPDLRICSASRCLRPVVAKRAPYLRAACDRPMAHLVDLAIHGAQRTTTVDRRSAAARCDGKSVTLLTWRVGNDPTRSSVVQRRLVGCGVAQCDRIAAAGPTAMRGCRFGPTTGSAGGGAGQHTGLPDHCRHDDISGGGARVCRFVGNETNDGRARPLCHRDITGLKD